MKQEIKHTTGPWKVSLHKKCDWDAPQAEIYAKDGLNDGFVIAELYGQYDGHANANLIAAAPDLYGALEACNEYLTYAPDNEKFSAVVEKIEATLKKARGEL